MVLKAFRIQIILFILIYLWKNHNRNNVILRNLTILIHQIKCNVILLALIVFMDIKEFYCSTAFINVWTWYHLSKYLFFLKVHSHHIDINSFTIRLILRFCSWQCKNLNYSSLNIYFKYSSIAFYYWFFNRSIYSYC